MSTNNLRYARDILGQRFYSERESRVFCSHSIRGIWKHCNRHNLVPRVRVGEDPGNEAAIASHLRKPRSGLRCQPVFCPNENENPAFKNSSAQLAERLRKAPFTKWISIDGRLNCGGKAAFYIFFKRSVYGASYEGGGGGGGVNSLIFHPLLYQHQ